MPTIAEIKQQLREVNNPGYAGKTKDELMKMLGVAVGASVAEKKAKLIQEDPLEAFSGPELRAMYEKLTRGIKDAPPASKFVPRGKMLDELHRLQTPKHLRAILGWSS